MSARRHQNPGIALIPTQQGPGRLTVDLDLGGQPLARLGRQGDTYLILGIDLQIQPQAPGGWRSGPGS
jgi:hypothetical protein